MTAAARIQPPGTALVQEKVASILSTDEARKHIAPLLQPGVSLERVMSTILQVAADNPEILECTPASIVLAVGKGVKWDLEFGETVHLVPFNVKVSKKGEADRWEKRAKAIRDYKGDIELVVRSGAARSVDANCFYAHEPFKYEQGTSPYIEHHPVVDPVKRGAMLGAYAWARINVHSIKIAVMSVAEIDAIRQAKSQSWKNGSLPDWYARKTMIHQVTKSIPKNPKLAAVIQDFEREEEEIPEGSFEVLNGSARVGAPDVQPPAAAAADDTPTLEDEPGLNGMTLEEAKATTLIGPPGSWQGKVGQLLDSFSNSHLEKIRTWLREKIEEKGEDRDKEIMATAITLLLDDREKNQTTMELGASNGKSTSVKMSPGGKVEDAIQPKAEKAKAGSKAGLPF